MAAELVPEMIPVCFEIQREMLADERSENYKKRQREYPDQTTFQLYDNNNPRRDDISLNQILLEQVPNARFPCWEDNWSHNVDSFRNKFDKPGFRRKNNLSDSLEIMVYRKKVTIVVELLYSEMSEVEFNTEFEKHIDFLRQKGVKHPFSLITGIKRIPYFSEHRKLIIHDLRRLPPEKRARTSGPRPKIEKEI